VYRLWTRQGPGSGYADLLPLFLSANCMTHPAEYLSERTVQETAREIKTD